MRIADTSALDVQLAPPNNRNRQIMGGSILLPLLVLIWIAVPVVKRWANAAVTVPIERLRVATVTRGDLVRDVSVQGRVLAAISPTLYSTAPGSITLLVDAGATVEEGKVVAVVVLAVALNIWMVQTFDLTRLAWYLIPAAMLTLWVVGQAAVYGPAHRASLVSPAVATRSV